MENGSYSSLNLFSGGSDSNSKLKDYLVFSLLQSENIGKRTFKPYALFLEGEFWGIYWLTERYDESYFSRNYNIDSRNVVEVKNEEIEIGNEGDLKTYKNIVQFIVENDMSKEETYEKVSECIDLNNYIDYYALEIYLTNFDWPNNNVAVWRSKYTGNHMYEDSKWRNLLFDVNLAMSISNVNSDWIVYTCDRDDVFNSLMNNNYFQQMIIDRLLLYAFNDFYPEKVDNFIDVFKEEMTEPIASEYRRFFDSYRTINDFYADCDNVREYFHQRYLYITEKYMR